MNVGAVHVSVCTTRVYSYCTHRLYAVGRVSRPQRLGSFFAPHDDPLLCDDVGGATLALQPRAKSAKGAKGTHSCNICGETVIDGYVFCQTCGERQVLG